MCLIVSKNGEGSFSIPDFRASWNRNSDGTGIMYVENDRVVVEKTDSKILKDHLDLYYKHMQRNQFILHHRYATQGEKTMLNIHPFCVTNKDDGDPYDLWFCHNGGISMNHFDGEYDKRLSDTHLFAVQYLRPLLRQYPDIITNDVFQKMLTDFLGHSNKLAFLRSDGMIYIFNRQQGDEHNGCWLSNKYSVANSTANTYNYARNHGTRSSNYDANEFYANAYEDYYEDNGVWRKDWNTANRRKEKSAESMSELTPDEILESIEQYAGMQEGIYEKLFIDEPHLVFDMINFLSIEDVSPNLLNDKSEIVAAKLYELMQGYAKKKAA